MSEETKPGGGLLHSIATLLTRAQGALRPRPATPIQPSELRRRVYEAIGRELAGVDPGSIAPDDLAAVCYGAAGDVARACNASGGAAAFAAVALYQEAGSIVAAVEHLRLVAQQHALEQALARQGAQPGGPPELVVLQGGKDDQ